MPPPISLEALQHLTEKMIYLIPAGEIAKQREISEIISGLYISDCLTAQSIGADHYKGPVFTHVLSILSENDMGSPGWMPDPGPSTTEIQRKLIVLKDRVYVNIIQHFPEATEWIRDALMSAKSGQPQVLVHCVRGVSRSATVVAAYLIRFYMKPRPFRSDDAVRYLKKMRQIVEPNGGFLAQLDTWSKCGCDLYEWNEAERAVEEKLLYRERKEKLEVWSARYG